MESISQEQILALGAVGIIIMAVAAIVALAVMAGTLKLSISLLGGSSPSYLACVGWLLGITFVNSFIIVGTITCFGQGAALLATPLTWFVTLYMVSSAADCGLFRAFGIWIVNSILSTIGLVAVVFVLMIPLAMLGAVVDNETANLEAQFQAVEAQLDNVNEEQTQLERVGELVGDTPGLEIGETTEVSLKSGSSSQALSPAPPSQKPKSSRQRSTPTRSTAPARAADGTTINPFFQN